MSNLGKYQKITTEAAKAGGVDPWLRQIERNAVEHAAPGIIAATVIVTTVAHVAVNRWRAHRQEVRSAAAEARANLTEGGS